MNHQKKLLIHPELSCHSKSLERSNSTYNLCTWVFCSYLGIIDERAHWTGGFNSLLPLPSCGIFDGRMRVILPILSYADTETVCVTGLCRL